MTTNAWIALGIVAFALGAIGLWVMGRRQELLAAAPADNGEGSVEEGFQQLDEGLSGDALAVSVTGPGAGGPSGGIVVRIAGEAE